MPEQSDLGWEADIVICVELEPKGIMSNAKSRIMYIEDKSQSLNGPAWIGRVTFSKSRRSLHYRGRTFQSLSGSGFKANYFDVETGDQFWISGPRKDGNDRLYASTSRPVEIDADVETEYWRNIRECDNPIVR